MKRRSIHLLNILKIVSLLLLVFLFACQTETKTVIHPTSENMPDEEADSVRIVYTDNNRIEYELLATKVRKYKETRKTLADTVYITVYDDSMQVQSTLYSDMAEVDDVNNIIIAEGNVVVTSENGILKTPYLTWDRKTDEMMAKNGVEITRNNNVLTGEELQTDMNMERLVIKQVSAEGTLDEETIDW